MIYYYFIFFLLFLFPLGIIKYIKNLIKNKVIYPRSENNCEMPESKSPTTVAIHIFRRDYRLYDNTTLIETCKTHDIVIPIFIFTPKQIDPQLNPYRSDNSVQFLCESLLDLDKQIKNAKKDAYGLFVFYGDDITILESLIKTISLKTISLKTISLKTISFNADYTKYSQKRDADIAELCKKHGITCLIRDDICLHPPGTIITTTGKTYTKFTPFWRASASKDIRKPSSNPYNNYLTSGYLKSGITDHKNLIVKIEDIMKPGGIILRQKELNPDINVHGGREHGLAILSHINKWKDYNDEHDNLSWETTHLSAYNKFGCVSIREVYHSMHGKLGNSNGVIRQLFWRDFFYHLSAKYPEIYEHALNPRYRAIHWENNAKWWNAWKEGRTGFPVVDACMRELNSTGYMHNRGRLIVSSFLCRLMHINWQDGERYFASKLVDYDPAQNNFGWQVSGANSSGTTSRPLEQTILNPWIQSAQFDRDGEYIKKWCPELTSVKASDLHKWFESDISGKWLSQGVKYLEPILDYKIEREKNLKMYKKYI